MIVYEGVGDILKTDVQTLVCPVNTVGAMGAGLALAMRKRYAGLYQHYRHLCKTKRLRIGVCAIYKVPHSNQQILLFPTKGDWRKPSQVEYIEEALEYLMEHLGTFNIQDIAFPPVGCGYGNLDFSREVLPLLHRYLHDEPDIDVSILLPPPRWS